MPTATIHIGDVTHVIPSLTDGSFDACLCDPPYGLSFMGKEWDHGVPSAETWREVWRVLKPGAMLLAFGGTRTYHRLAVAIEDAGFEIRDCMMWLYGSGFPKSHNNFGFDGYGTALKPAWEPVIVAMKPLDGTFARNAVKHGVAGLNIDGCRIGTAADMNPRDFDDSRRTAPKFSGILNGGKEGQYRNRSGTVPDGRWPANVILDEAAAAMLDEQSGDSVSTDRPRCNTAEAHNRTPSMGKSSGDWVTHGYTDAGGASRFFYTAKADTAERNAGLPLGMKNLHPTVKPIDLCAYLARLILPPQRDTPRRILIPFSGSGSETIGALKVGWDEAECIELDAEHVRVAEMRIVGDAPMFNRVQIVRHMQVEAA